MTQEFPERRAIGTTGVSVSAMGLGTAALGGLLAAVSEEDATATMEAASAAGLAYIDTAPFYGYGLSEHRVGRHMRLHGRDRFVLSTKAGRLLRPRTRPQEPGDAWHDPLPFEPIYDYGYDAVMRSVEDSFQRLGTDRIDILFMHDIGRVTHGPRHEELMATAMSGGAEAMRKLKAEGTVKAIGLGVNEWEVCAEALEHGDWDVFLLAGRYTLLEQTVLDHFFPLCADRGARIVIGGPYNSGILAGGDTFNYEQAPDDVVRRVAGLRSVCDDHGVPLPAAALQFVLKHPLVVSVIPGARTAEELRQNLAYLSFQIPDALWSDLRDAGLLHPGAPT